MVGGAEGRGQERYEEEILGCGGQGGWIPKRTSGGGVRGPRGSGTAALVEVVLRNRFGLGGIELRALVEVVREGFLGGLFCFPTGGPHVKLNLGWAPGGMGERGGGGLADMGKDLCDGLGIGEERDEREGFLAGGTDQGEDLIDPGQEGGPPGGPGGGGIGWLRCWGLWRLGFGRGGRRSQGKPGTGVLNGQGIVLVGASRNEGSQRSVGGEDPVVAVAVDTGRGKDRGQS